MEIGRIEKVDLRDIWKNEARDFVPWLEDNIEVLAESLGINLESPEREKGVGTFKADILAEDEADKPVVIECQLGKSDHDHLGKILTYMTNLDCKIAIWICSDPRPEHITTINWLNETTPLDTFFYLVKVEAVRIVGSPPAPLFYIMSGPSEEVKEIGEKKSELAERHKKRLDFWESLKVKAKGRTKLFINIKPSKEDWISTSAGVPGLKYIYAIGVDWSVAQLEIDKGKGSEGKNKQIFDYLIKHKTKIENSFGGALVWDYKEGRRSCHIKWAYEGEGLRDMELWGVIQDRMIDAMIRLDKALRPYYDGLKKN